MAARLSAKYGIAAVAVAVLIIAAAIFFTPNIAPTGTTTSRSQQSQGGNFLVLLTDPPNVPAGTTQLNLTYSAVTLRVGYPNGTAKSVPVSASGTVDLLSLVNVTQTIASVTLPAGTSVTGIQFTIASVEAEVNGQAYPVTTLSNQLSVSISNRNSVNSSALSGAILDLNPTLIEVRATNSTGGAVSYFVLVPSATAIVKTGMSSDNSKVGNRVEMNQNDREELDHAQQNASKNVAITSTTLSSAGNTTTFSITLKNLGNSSATIFGLTLHGPFSVTFPANTCSAGSSRSSSSTSSTTSSTTSTAAPSEHGMGNGSSDGHGDSQGHGQNHCNESNVKDHPDTVPFKINGTSLVPLLGDNHGEDVGDASSITLGSGQSVTLSFSGVIQLRADSNHGNAPAIVILPANGSTYSVRLMGEGFQTSQVTAT